MNSSDLPHLLDNLQKILTDLRSLLALLKKKRIQLENKNNPLSVNKEKIYNYIKQKPQTRMKDIIEEFSVLSERTVKRNLRELLDGGLLQKGGNQKERYYKVS